MKVLLSSFHLSGHTLAFHLHFVHIYANVVRESSAL